VSNKSRFEKMKEKNIKFIFYTNRFLIFTKVNSASFSISFCVALGKLPSKIVWAWCVA